MSNAIAKFSIVSFEQFRKDAEELMGLNAPEAYLRELYDELKLPTRSTAQSAGYDFYFPFEYKLIKGMDNGVYQPIKIPTGIRVEIDPSWFFAIMPRSGLGFKYQSQLLNTIGIIDADFIHSDSEGHIIVGMKADKSFILKRGDRFVQGIFLPYGVTVDDNASGERSGGFGSTGR